MKQRQDKNNVESHAITSPLPSATEAQEESQE